MSRASRIEGPGVTHHYAVNIIEGGPLTRSEEYRFASLASRVALSRAEFREMARLYRKSGRFMRHTGHGVSLDEYINRVMGKGP
jgi:hypothetical protein